MWTGQVIETNDMSWRLDKLGDDACIRTLMDGVVPEDDNGEKQAALRALPVLPESTASRRLIEPRFWSTRRPPFAVLATRP